MEASQIWSKSVLFCFLLKSTKLWESLKINKLKVKKSQLQETKQQLWDSRSYCYTVRLTVTIVGYKVANVCFKQEQASYSPFDLCLLNTPQKIPAQGMKQAHTEARKRSENTNGRVRLFLLTHLLLYRVCHWNTNWGSKTPDVIHYWDTTTVSWEEQHWCIIMCHNCGYNYSKQHKMHCKVHYKELLMH